MLLIAAALIVWRARRGLVRRVVNASLRLEETPSAHDHRFLDKNLARLERAVDSSVLARGEATVAVGRMAQALETIPQGVVICDENGEVTFRNQAATTFSSARHGDALVGAAIEEMLRKALDGDRDTRTLDLFGPPRRTLVVTAAPLDNERRTVGALGIIDDVSERRRLEAVRRDFVANISHELKTPIGALGLLAETLLAEDDPDISRRLAERMLTEAFRVGRTIDDLLALSRIEAEEAPSREPVPVHLVVAEAVERMRPAAEQQGIEVRVAEARRNLTMMGDRRQLVSAIYNLLDNAVKYSDAGSAVDVRCRCRPTAAAWPSTSRTTASASRRATTSASSSASTASTVVAAAIPAARASAWPSCVTSPATMAARSSSRRVKARARPSRWSCRPGPPASAMRAG